MKVTYTDNITSTDQLYDNVRIPKYLMAQLVDYFIFRRQEEQMKFTSDGELHHVKGVPMEIMNIIKQMVKVSQKPKTYFVETAFSITTYESEDDLYNRMIEEAPNTAQSIRATLTEVKDETDL
jgi:dsDNA-binding SOS-regulon protein